MLQQLEKDEQWILNKITTTFNVNVNDVLMATIDNNEILKIFLYK